MQEDGFDTPPWTALDMNSHLVWSFGRSHLRLEQWQHHRKRGGRGLAGTSPTVRDVQPIKTSCLEATVWN